MKNGRKGITYWDATNDKFVCKFVYQSCSDSHNRDINAEKNILND